MNWHLEFCVSIWLPSREFIQRLLDAAWIVVGRIQACDEPQHKLYVSELNIHKSQSVKRLTALATCFLPLLLRAKLHAF
jgi:hypothetical protein